jgi:phosphoadenosine phosphosulfate reductase
MRDQPTTSATLEQPQVDQSIDLDAVNERLASADAPDVIRWAADAFGEKLVMTSSFGAQSAVMLHLATRIVPEIPVIFIDTGFHFPETYQFAEQLAQRLHLNLKVYQSPISAARMSALYGRLWEGDAEQLNRYDNIRKVEPQLRALRELNAHALLTGVRGGQTDNRAEMRRVDMLNGVYNVRPILPWSQKDVHDYLKQHDLPYHPLVEKGYKSIGDWHSTETIGGDEHERAGRFRGLKQECGLHLPQTEAENQSLGSAGL